MLKLKYSLLVLAVFMTAGLVLSANAHANPVCETLEECRSLRTYLQEQMVQQESQVVRDFLQSQLTQVDARIEELLTCQPGGETRTTTTGAVFTRDRSNEKLSEAWRDPDGIIWGDIVKETDGTAHYMNHREATNYCTSIGARLPSKEEFTRLREYMGARSGTYEGYSAQVLPNLSGNWFWSSSVDPSYAYGACGFDGSGGNIYTGLRYDNNAVRCVVGR